MNIVVEIAVLAGLIELMNWHNVAGLVWFVYFVTKLLGWLVYGSLTALIAKLVKQ